MLSMAASSTKILYRDLGLPRVLEFVGLVRIVWIFGRVILSGRLRFVSLAFEFAFSLHSPVLTMQHGAVTLHE